MYGRCNRLSEGGEVNMGGIGILITLLDDLIFSLVDNKYEVLLTLYISVHHKHLIRWKVLLVFDLVLFSNTSSLYALCPPHPPLPLHLTGQA